ncbi:hypothetical protein [Rhizobium sp. BT-226]|uniref:hypothetical protein n=1 Tax=Rhizobium sp. BT-226 TaxID=2986922 RepID=UPI0021F7C1B9|nr:hypothetical protein [Rhizobium sp. BT-226]MCW0014873.1 hypothetical protein [Rhizobium sp. BT-226]
MSDDRKIHGGAGSAAMEFSESIKAIFSDNKHPATKNDVANLYVTAILLFDAISAATSNLSYDPRSAEGIAAEKRYADAMDRSLNSIKTGIEQMVESQIDER